MNKKYIAVFIMLEMVVGSLGSVAMAAGAASGTKQVREGACAAFTSRIDKLAGQVAERRGKLEDLGKGRETKLEDQWKEFAQKREDGRAQRDENIAARIAKLSSRNLTDAQKQAVAVFESATKAALEAKRTAVDAAVNAFHDGVVSLLDARTTAVEAAFTARADAYKIAADKAKADCAAGVVAIKTIREAFLAALKAAQTQFVSARKANEDFTVKMKSLEATKKAALEKAQSDFKAAVEAARTALKAVFPKPAASSTNP
jgi:hypothetical protein